MKKDNYLILFIKGFIIGLGIIFPISASYLAVGLGVYKRLLDDINNLFKCFKKEYKFLLSVGFGIVLSALVSCLLINYTLKLYPIATLLFFISLILGGMPLLFKKANKEKKPVNFIWTILGIILLVGISLLGSGKNVIITTDALGLLKVFGAGALAAGTMIIPGVSGSAILVIIGFYEPMLEIISNVVHFQNLNINILIILIFGIGMILGIFIVSKIMGYLLEKHEIKTYYAIIGFVGASIINIIITLFNYAFNIWEFIIGLILFGVGLWISHKYLKEE